MKELTWVIMFLLSVSLLVGLMLFVGSHPQYNMSLNPTQVKE